MFNLKLSSVCLLGYGISNQSMCRHLMKNGITPTVRCEVECELPKGVKGVFGKGYLDTIEDVVFRSPGIRADRINARGQIYTEAIYSLNKLTSYKIGVSGSDGKTTTATLIYRMLCVGGKNPYLCGNIGKPVADLLDIAVQKDYIVAELSSFQLMDESVTLDVGAITNITENHLDYHRDMGEYIEAKRNIIKNARRAVLSYDDERVRALGYEGCVYFSLEDMSCYVGGKTTYVYIKNGDIYYNSVKLFPIKDICLKGMFNVRNVLCAIGCVYPLVGVDACHSVAKEFCGVGNRQEYVGEINGVKFICSSIDTTPARTVSTLSALPKENTVAILGGYDKNLSYGCLRSTLSGVKSVILCGENRDKIAQAINRRATLVNTMEEAVNAAYRSALPGDTVILTPASASFDMFKNYKEKADCFKSAVRKILNTEL